MKIKLEITIIINLFWYLIIFKKLLEVIDILEINTKESIII